MYSLSIPLKFASDFEAESREAWFEIIPAQSVYAADGERLEFTKKSLEELIDNASKYKTPLSIDYDHQTIKASEKTGPIETAGWITDLELRDNSLWGYGKFTKKAIELIRNGSYAFSSPVIQRNVTDRKTGKKLEYNIYNVALTSNPVLDGQTPIQLSKVGEQMPNDNKDESKNVPTDPPSESAGQPPENKGGLDFGPIIAKIVEGLGVTPEQAKSILEENVDALIAVLKDPSAVGKVNAMSKELATADSQIVALSKRIETLEAERETERKAKEEEDKVALAKKVEDHVGALMADGYVLPEWKDDAIELFSQNWEKGEKRYHLARVVPVGKTQSGIDPKTVVPKIDSLSKEAVNAVSILRNVKVHGRPLFRDDNAIADTMNKLKTA